MTLGGIDEGESLVRLVWAEALFANDQEVAGRAAISDAQRRLRARADRIVSAEVREAFLTQVPENALTLEIALAWTD